MAQPKELTAGFPNRHAFIAYCVEQTSTQAEAEALALEILAKDSVLYENLASPIVNAAVQGWVLGRLSDIRNQMEYKLPPPTK